MIEFLYSQFQSTLPTFRTNCTDGSHFAQMGSHFAKNHHPHTPFFTQTSHTPFGDIYVHKTPPNPPQNTNFPGLNLVGKTNYYLDPNLAKCLKSGQNLKKYSSHAAEGLVTALVMPASPSNLAAESLRHLVAAL